MAEMSIIEKLPHIVKNGRKKAEEILTRPLGDQVICKETIIPNSFEKNNVYGKGCINQLFQGDNLVIIEKLIKEGYRSKIDLIYIDPPFLTNANYKGRILIGNGKEEEVIEKFAYEDTWKEGLESYLEMLYIRILLMKELLSNKGTIYIHLDYRTIHYVKVLMDEIFGEENFINEIIWSYKSGGSSNRYFSRKHDTILAYGKTKDYIFNPQLEKSYNRNFKPYRFKEVEEFEDEIGWYTLVNMRDVWQIDMVGRTSKERVGYATQKPKKLLERIILSSSNEDSIIADFFAGSGTTGIVAEKLNRKWIMADKGALSSATINKRLVENNSSPYNIYKTSRSNVGEGKLLIKEMKIIEDKEGKTNLYLELGDYKLDINNINLRNKYKNTVKEVLERNSLGLIDFIGIDLDYDGNTPMIIWQDYRRKDKLIIDSKIKIKDEKLKNSKQIYIKYVDVFGSQSSLVLKINNERMVICQES